MAKPVNTAAEEALWGPLIEDTREHYARRLFDDACWGETVDGSLGDAGIEVRRGLRRTVTVTVYHRHYEKGKEARMLSRQDLQSNEQKWIKRCMARSHDGKVSLDTGYEGQTSISFHPRRKK